MLLRYFYDKKLAQASYMVGCAKTGEAIIVDPARNIKTYLQAAEEEGLKISHVTETHIHADYVSGSRELAARTGARLYLSDMGDEAWKYGFAETDENVVLVRDGDSWMVGNIRFEVMHTPGHTPEHIAFLVTDTAGADKPMGVFTGDFLFVGDIGRPDLLEEAAGLAGTKEVGARLQFQTVERFKQMPDYLQIWPAHGAGSACGKALGAIPSTTLGYEKLFNPAFQFEEEDAFVEWLLDGQPEAPRYFAQMKHVNKVGPALLENLPTPQKLDRIALDKALADGDLVIDTRNIEDFAKTHIPSTVNIPLNSGGFVTYIGWFADFDAPTYFIAPSENEVQRIVTAMHSIGVDNVPGYFTAEVVGEEMGHLPIIKAPELAQRKQQNGLVIVDVRGKSEYAEQHVAGAVNIPLGYIPRSVDELPRDHDIVTHCSSGVRSQIAASLLRKHGFDNVTNLRDSTDALFDALPTE
jgi:hydroxyacylglutathione hydrolase